MVNKEIILNILQKEYLIKKLLNKKMMKINNNETL